MSKISNIKLVEPYEVTRKEKYYDNGNFDSNSGPLCRCLSNGGAVMASLGLLLDLLVSIEVQESKDGPWVECTKFKHCRDGIDELYAVRDKV